MKLIKLALSKVRPYERNPRYNDDAVEAVMESIRQCEYIQPIVIDENYQILAGHTRFKALYNLGYEEAEFIEVDGLTKTQKRKFRLLDNKTAEIATWDHERLVAELDRLDFGNFDFWSKELEKMGTELIEENEEPEEKVIRCPKCGRVFVPSVPCGALEE